MFFCLEYSQRFLLVLFPCVELFKIPKYSSLLRYLIFRRFFFFALSAIWSSSPLYFLIVTPSQVNIRLVLMQMVVFRFPTSFFLRRDLLCFFTSRVLFAIFFILRNLVVCYILRLFRVLFLEFFIPQMAMFSLSWRRGTKFLNSHTV